MKNIDEINKLKKTLEIREKFIEQLKESNEQLKKEVKQIGSAFIKKGDYARELEKQLEFSRTHKSVIDVEKIKYKQTLQKIKEYLEDIDYIAQFDGTPYDLSVEIKQIITKAEEE